VLLAASEACDSAGSVYRTRVAGHTGRPVCCNVLYRQLGVAFDVERCIRAGASWRASMRRGMPYTGRCIVMRKYATSVRKYANQTFDRIVGPPAESDNPRMRRQSSRFALLEEVRGMPLLGLAKRIHYSTPSTDPTQY
jgi:hypothetical protein